MTILLELALFIQKPAFSSFYSTANVFLVIKQMLPFYSHCSILYRLIRNLLRVFIKLTLITVYLCLLSDNASLNSFGSHVSCDKRLCSELFVGQNTEIRILCSV